PIVAGAAALVMECSGGTADWQGVRDTLRKAVATNGAVLDPTAGAAGCPDADKICPAVLIAARAEIPELQWDLVDGEMLPIVELVPHVPAPPGPIWIGQRALALTWNGPQPGFRLRAESPARGIAKLQIELPLAALDSQLSPPLS